MKITKQPDTVENVWVGRCESCYCEIEVKEKEEGDEIYFNTPSIGPYSFCPSDVCRKSKRFSIIKMQRKPREDKS